MILVLLTIALFVVAVFQQDLRLPLLFLTFSAVVGAILAGIQLGSERITTASLHLFGVWLMLGVAPLLAYRAGLFDWHYSSYHFFPFVPTSEELVLASIAVLLWLLFFIFGYRIRVQRAVLWIKTYDLRISLLGITAQSVIGCIALVYIYEQVGFGVLTRGGFEAFEYDTPGELAFFTSTIRSVPLVALLAITLALRDGALRGVKRVFAAVIGTGLLIGNALINNPVAAPRFFTGTVLLAFAFVLFFHRTRNGLSFLLLALVSVFVMFPLLDVGRFAMDTDSLIDDAPLFLGGILSDDPYRAFEVIPAAIRYVEQYGSTLGFQLLGPLLFWVPRSYWPDKPEGSGAFLVQAFGGFFENISCPAPCEALVNFGWIGIPIIALAFAITLRVLDDVSRLSSASGQQTPSIRFTDLVYPLLLGQVFFLTRGDFLSPWAFTVGMIIATAPMVMAEILGRLISPLTSSNRL